MDQWNHGLKNMDVQQTMLWDAQTPAASEFQLWTRRLTSTLCKYFFQIQTLDLKRLCLTFISGLKPQLKFAPTFHTDNPLKITQLMAVRLSEKNKFGRLARSSTRWDIIPSIHPSCLRVSNLRRTFPRPSSWAAVKPPGWRSAPGARKNLEMLKTFGHPERKNTEKQIPTEIVIIYIVFYILFFWGLLETKLSNMKQHMTSIKQ